MKIIDALVRALNWAAAAFFGHVAHDANGGSRERRVANQGSHSAKAWHLRARWWIARHILCLAAERNYEEQESAATAEIVRLQRLIESAEDAPSPAAPIHHMRRFRGESIRLYKRIEAAREEAKRRAEEAVGERYKEELAKSLDVLSGETPEARRARVEDLIRQAWARADKEAAEKKASDALLFERLAVRE